MSTTFEKNMGNKTLYGIVEGPTTTIMIDCDILNGEGLVKFKVPTLAATQYFSGGPRPHIQDLFPETPKELREVFVTGMTPAEFDINVKGQRMPKTIAAFKRKYSALGYCFENQAS